MLCYPETNTKDPPINIHFIQGVIHLLCYGVCDIELEYLLLSNLMIFIHE